LIKQIQIKNFQSHKDTKLEFGDGVNIIRGQSDTGKSAIFRAIRWLKDNRPQGDAFRSNFASTKAVVDITVEFGDGSWVSRRRGGTVNSYVTSNNDELEALRSEVPEEVRAIVQLEDYNIQGQHDKYFMLQSTAGEVAKMLNDIVGLDIIDTCYKKINSIILDSKREFDRCDSQIEGLKEELEAFKDFETMVKRVDKFEEQLVARQKCREERTGLIKYANNLERLVQEISDFDKWLSLEDSVRGLFIEANKMESMVNNRQTIEGIITSVQTIRTEIEDLDFEAEHEKWILEMIEVIRENKRVILQVKEIHDVVDDLKDVLSDIDNAEGDLEYKNAALRKFLNDHRLCPTCGSELTDETIRRMLG